MPSIDAGEAVSVGAVADNGDGSYTIYPRDRMEPWEWEENLPKRRLWGFPVIIPHEAVVGDYQDRVPQGWFAREVIQERPALLAVIPFGIAALVMALITACVLL